MTNFKQDIQNHNVKRALRLLSTEVKDDGDLQKSVGFLSTLFNDGLLKGFIDDIGHKNFFDKLDVVVDELCKARKDLSKLKKVQKMVTRGGRTFTQTYYEEVEPKNKKEDQEVLKESHLENDTDEKTNQCLKKIGESLYTINKEAKKIRDAKKDLFDYQRGNIKYIPENLADLIDLKINESGQIVVYDKDGQEYTSLDKIKDDFRDYESDIDANENRLNEIDNELDDSDNEEDFDDLKKEKKEIQEELDWQKDILKNLESIKEEMEELNDSLKYGMNTLKEKESDLYELKNKILKLINPTAIEYHGFKGGDIRPLYKIGDFTFHGEDVSETYEGEVSKELEEISSENKMTDKINPKEAISYLEGLLKNPESLKKAIDVIFQKSVKNDVKDENNLLT